MLHAKYLMEQELKTSGIDTPDFADYIVRHLDDKNLTVSIGGRETYAYEQIARMYFEAAGKEPVIKFAPRSFSAFWPL